MPRHDVARRHHSRPVAPISIAVIFLAAVHAPPVAARESTPDAAARMLSMAAMEKDGLPSLSVALARNGVIVFAEAYGLADVENDVAATPRSVYRIGSISKTLTAAAVMILAEDGALDLDAPVQKYCPAFPSKKSPITPRLLLSHRAGIRDYDYRRFNEEFLSTRRYDSLEEALSIFKNDPLEGNPGTEYQYSSFGYVLLGCAAEGASGVPYEKLLKRRVLDPAGMEQTTLDRPDTIIPHRASGYGKRSDGSWANAVYVDLSDRFPAGGLLSTPRDLVAFGNALLSGTLLGPDALQSMWGAAPGTDHEETVYGLGWRVAPGRNEVFHGGTSVGGSAYLYIDRDGKIVVAFATNMGLWTEPRHELARRLAATLDR